MANFKLPYTGTNWNKHNGVGVTLIENWFEERAVAEQKAIENERAQKELDRRMLVNLARGDIPHEIRQIQKENEEIDRAQERLKKEQENLVKMKEQLQNRMSNITDRLQKLEKEQNNPPSQDDKDNARVCKQGKLMDLEYIESERKEFGGKFYNGAKDWESTFQHDYCHKTNKDIFEQKAPITAWGDNIYSPTSENEKEKIQRDYIRFPRNTNFTKPLHEYGF